MNRRDVRRLQPGSRGVAGCLLSSPERLARHRKMSSPLRRGPLDLLEMTCVTPGNNDCPCRSSAASQKSRHPPIPVVEKSPPGSKTPGPQDRASCNFDLAESLRVCVCAHERINSQQPCCRQTLISTGEKTRSKALDIEHPSGSRHGSWIRFNAPQ